VREERIRWAHVPAAATGEAGGVFDFGVADIHRVLHAGPVPAVTIHAYSPVPRIMGAYVPVPAASCSATSCRRARSCARTRSPRLA
jgi:hypothetical protein